MHETHLVIGAGPVGSAVATALARQGHQVHVATRSGSGPEHPGIERISADASDTHRMRQLATGSVAIYNCASPAYTRWDTDWPPIAASLLDAAEKSGAVLATVSNLYVYGRVDGPMSQRKPLAPIDHKGEIRAKMWRDALAVHEAGAVRAVEVRASDYADAGQNSPLARNARAVLAGKGVWVLGAADQPHSWTAVSDTAALLIAAAADPEAHGRPWLVPTAPPRTQRQALTDLTQQAGLPAPTVRTLGPRTLRVAGLFSPLMRELSGTAYQFTAPFVLDDSATRTHFGLQPQPWEATLAGIAMTARGGADTLRAA